MSLSSILKSLHGRRIGLGHRGELLVNGMNDEQRGRIAFKTITSAQLLALNATPIEVIAAPDSGFAHIVKRVIIHKPAGTAYAGVAAGEDLVLKYTNGSGAEVSAEIETTGFLDQTAAKTAVAAGVSANAAVGSYLLVSAAAVVLHLLSGEITTGDSPLYVRVEYDTVKLAVTA